MTTPQPFSQAWTLEDTKAYMALQATRPKDHTQPEYQAWIETQYRPMSERLVRAVGGHLLHLAKLGALVVPDHTEDVETTWLRYWRALVVDHKVDYPAGIFSGFRSGITMELRIFSDDNPQIEDIHARLVSLVDTGSFDEVWCDTQECQRHGQRISLRLTNWRPEMGTIDRKAGPDAPFVPLVAGQFGPRTVHHTTIPVPSGELLINDWFRIDAFSRACRALDEDKMSINIHAGCVQQTLRYAQELGFAHVMVGNSVPSVVARDGRIDIGHYDEDEEGGMDGDHLGNVCTDLWWTTIIDKQVLLDICATAMPREQALQEIDAFLAQYDHTVMTTQVPPGTYHLYFSGDTETFAEKFDSPDADMSAFEKPMFILSPVPLNLAKPARTKSARGP